MRIYAIGCDELPERKAACLEHLRASGVSARFWRSFHGRSWGLETTREFDPGQRISPGHVGLLLGHYSLWNHLTHVELDACGRERDAWIVLEDDAVVPAAFQLKVDDVRGDLERYFPDWDFVFLGLAEPDGPRVWNKITERIGPPGSRLCRLEWPWGTHAYMVRRRALPILMDRMAVAERNMDQQLYDRVLRDNRLKWCAVLPSLVLQRTYDHRGAGTPEWAPSTISPGERGYFAPGESPERESPPPRESVEVAAATLAVIDPFPCVLRGEQLDEHGRGELRRSVPVSQCAFLNQPCHSKKAELVGAVLWRGGPAVACGSCERRTSMAPPVPGTVRPRLPLPEGHFNPSIHMWQGRSILATRDSWGHSKVALWFLDNDEADWSGAWSVAPIGAYGSNHPDAPRLEDPRLFAARGPDGMRLHAMFNLPDGYPPKRVRVGYVRFDENLTGIEETAVFPSPFGNAYEKNWVPFWHDGRIRWVYATKPEHVVLDSGGECRTPNPLPWHGGVVRGGASPVLAKGADGEFGYHHFFHGCLKRFQGSVYSVGCCVFEAKPPFRVLRQTAVPLAWPELPGADEEVVKSHVIWPGGAVRHAGAWWLACGVDDTHCRMIRLGCDEVERALSDVPEVEPNLSLRDTPLALGTNGII